MTTASTRSRRGRRALAVALCAAVALLAAVASVHHFTFLPPGLQGARHLEIAGAAAHAVVDQPKSVIADTRTKAADFESRPARAVLMAELMGSAPVRARISRDLKIPVDAIATDDPVTVNAPAVFHEPDSERRADAIAHAAAPYRLNIQPSPNLPILDIYAQAPTPRDAERLAGGAIVALRAYLADLAVKDGADPAAQVRLQQLGPARGKVINGGAAPTIAVFTFLVVFLVCGALLAVAHRVRRGWVAAAGHVRDAAAAPAEEAASPPTVDAPEPEPGPPARFRPSTGSDIWFSGPPPIAVAAATALPAPGGAVVLPRPRVRRSTAERSRPARLLTAAGDWPRTTRVMPWMLAAFMAVVWLVPFNTIQLTASLPIDLKFDRLILPFIVATWVLVMAAGGRGAPRVRVTMIHVALGAFVACSCLSLVFDAPALNQALEFDRGVKQLTLIVSYLTLFVILASVVRRSEVRPFLIYTLVLASLCAIGMIWEYRFHYNLFYDWSGKLLPGIFQVGSAESTGVDEIGRRLVRGPGEVPLEAVAMLSMALPIALVGLLREERTRNRLLYGLAACLILAAAISTYRKSAFLAPIAVVLTLACFERRRLLRLAPLGVVALGAIHVLSPGAFGSIAFQLHGNRLGVTTVSDRASDYDAVRPDVWSHLAFGRGFGAYDHNSYRILDMEMLHRLIEGGVVGVAAYIFIVVAVIVVARRIVASHDPAGKTAALIAAAAAVGFLVVSTLFDVISFPHCPYIFLFLAGFLAVMAKPADDPPAAGALRAGGA